MATNWNCASSVQLVISDLNEIAADAYRHRIRSTLKKGGNGGYDRSNGGFEYSLPKKLSVNLRARFEVTRVTANLLEVRAISVDDPACFVTAFVNGRGSLEEIMLPGRRIPPEERPVASGHRSTIQVHHPPAMNRAVLFYEES